MLRLFCSRSTFTSVLEAAELDQRAFGSLYHRGWIGHRAGKGFHATMAGRNAYKEYMEGEARYRKNADLPLSHYFDPIVYRLKREDHAKVNIHLAKSA